MAVADGYVDGAEFRDLRKRLGWTQMEATQFLRLKSVSTVSGWEAGRGTRGVPFSAFALLKQELDRLSTQVPLLSRIPAGATRELIDEGAIGTIDWERPNLRDTFYGLLVDGESMVTERINNGDIVIIRAQPTAETGQRVAALVNGEATLKRLERQNGVPYLYGTTDSRIITEDDDFTIAGIVYDVIAR